MHCVWATGGDRLVRVLFERLDVEVLDYERVLVANDEEDRLESLALLRYG